MLAGEGDSARVVESGHVADAVAFVAATASDTTPCGWSRRRGGPNPTLSWWHCQDRRANAPLFTRVGVDFGLVPAEVIAQVPHQGDAWAAQTVDRLVQKCGDGSPDLWRIHLSHDEPPALGGAFDGHSQRLEDLLRDPADRAHMLGIVALSLFRDGKRTMAPAADVTLRAGDQLLLAGRLRDRRPCTPR
ncbi:MAG: hypothetical protein ACR2JU_01135 [Nocardioidaceae bacterium]